MSSDDELRQKLAAIEHERWADWQQWMHSKLVRERRFEDGKHFLTGNLILSGDYYGRWQRQIDTPYDKLSDAEKASDMEQVDRYWPLIQKYIAAQRQHWLQEAIVALPDKRVLPSDHGNYPLKNASEDYCVGYNNAIDQVIAALQALAERTT